MNNGINILYQRLQDAETPSTMVRHSETYLTEQLLTSKAKDPYNCIQLTSHQLLHEPSH